MELNELMDDELDDIVGGIGTSQKKYVKIINCTSYVNVRKSTLSESDDNVIGKAYLGERYVFYGWHGNWVKIQFGSTWAYVYKNYVEIV